MIPTTWLSILAFPILIAPGLLYDLLGSRRHVEQKESTFREASRVVLASTFFSGLGLIGLSILRVVHAAWIVDPSQFLVNRDVYIANHYQTILWTFVFQEAFALSFVGIHYWFTIGDPVINTSSWQEAFEDRQHGNEMALVRIRMTTGQEWAGHAEWYSISIERDVREITLILDVDRDLADPLYEMRVILAAPMIESLVIGWDGTLRIPAKNSRWTNLRESFSTKRSSEN